MYRIQGNYLGSKSNDHYAASQNEIFKSYSHSVLC